MVDLLRRLDQALLPPLAAVLRWMVGGHGRRAVWSGLGMMAACVLLLAVVMTARAPSPGQGETIGVPVRVGVVAGDSIPAYVAATREKLSRLAPEPTFALVSLTAYLGPDRLQALFGQALPSRVYLRAPIAGVVTDIIPVAVDRLPDDVTAGMDAAAVRKDADASVARGLADRLTGNSPQERQLRAEYLARAQGATAEATAYKEHCSCVYAAVIKAEPAALMELSQRPGVRAVDPTPGLASLEQAEFLPPMPEQQTIVTSPGEPMPEPAPSRTPQTATPGPSSPSAPPPRPLVTPSVGPPKATPTRPSTRPSIRPSGRPSASPPSSSPSP